MVLGSSSDYETTPFLLGHSTYSVLLLAAFTMPISIGRMHCKQ